MRSPPAKPGKDNGEDLTPREKAVFEQAFQELLDVEHVIECLKLAAARFIDVPAAIRAHNDKCWQHGYVNDVKEAV